jgi:2,3-bisphosphoglycerate-independent phosphoglycerate mutase
VLDLAPAQHYHATAQLEPYVKYAIVIPEGAADQPMESLGNMTPLEAAQTPNLDYLASLGRCGTVALAAKKAPHSPHEDLLALLGTDCSKRHVGGGALEARGLGLPDSPGASLMHCNFTTVIDGTLTDPTGGRISPEEAQAVIDLLNDRLAPARLTFHVGRRHRHLMASDKSFDVQTTCPYECTGQSIRRNRPKGADADRLGEIMDFAAEALRGSDLNEIRCELGESPITGIWLWGEGILPTMPSFSQRFGLSGAMVAGDPVVRGIGELIGMDVADVPTATGYTDTDLAAKAAAATDALDRCDLVCVHVAWPDEASLVGDVEGKIAAIEAIDHTIVGELIRRMRSEDPHWRVLVAPSRVTNCLGRCRTTEAVPFMVAGERAGGVVRQPFNEDAARAADVHVQRGSDLMEFFLTVR